MAGAVASSLEEGVEAVGVLPLALVRGVSVEVQRDGDAGVAEALTDLFDRLAVLVVNVAVSQSGVEATPSTAMDRLQVQIGGRGNWIGGEQRIGQFEL